MSTDKGQPDRILLIGMMGAGKSTTGHLLAARLGWPCLDSDEEIIRRTGRTVPEIWHTQGEPAYRELESEVLQDAIATAPRAVIAVAGGAVLDPANRDSIRSGGLVVWLRARTETLVQRVGDGAGRPLLDDDPAAAMAALYDARRPVYDELADVAVDVDGRTPDEVVTTILAVRAERATRPEAADA